MKNETKDVKMSEAAKAARKLYYRKWEAENKEKRKAAKKAFWERQASKLISEGTLTPERIEQLNGRTDRE